MSSSHESAPIDGRAERLLGSLAGIVSAHVIRDTGGEIVEIHVLSTPELHPKQVVRNVESALSAGLGIEIDRRIVSVAQIRTPRDDTAPTLLLPVGPAPMGVDVPQPIPAAPHETASTRLEYVHYQSRRDAERCACEVTLRDGERQITGSGTGPDTAGGRAEAAARALLDAVERARPDLRLHLDGAIISTSRGRSFVIVGAHALLDRETISLAGAAPLARSPEEAAILATLQATNRWSA
jgi:hypothetical protein